MPGRTRAVRALRARLASRAEGRSIDDLCERSQAASDTSSYIVGSPERVAGQRLVWRGELEQARLLLTRFLALADERGEAASYALQRLHVCEFDLRAGEWDSASRLLDEWAESTDRELLFRPMYERCRAVLAAGRGLCDEATRWATDALARADASGCRWDKLEALRAGGIAALPEHDPEYAVESLRAVWEYTEREGVRDPGVFPVAPELVEALARARRAHGGACGDRSPASAGRGAAASLGACHSPAVRSARRSSPPTSTTRMRPPRSSRRPATTSTWACPSIEHDRCSAWAGRSGAYADGALRAASCRTALSAFEEHRLAGLGESGAIRGRPRRRTAPAAQRRADPERAARRGAGSESDTRISRSRRNSTSPSTRSRRTSRTATRSLGFSRVASSQPVSPPQRSPKRSGVSVMCPCRARTVTRDADYRSSSTCRRPTRGRGGRGERARAAAEELSGRGTTVRYRGLIFVPDEETCFVLFEAASLDAVRLAARLAALPCERVIARYAPPRRSA